MKLTYVFRYPKHFVTLPEYSAHRDQVVTVTRELIDGEEYDREDGEAMFEIQAGDGWVGHAWASELEPARCEHGMFFTGAGACPQCGGA